MVIVLKKGTSDDEIFSIKSFVEKLGLSTNISKGADTTVIGLIGRVEQINIAQMECRESVEKVLRVREPFKKVNREFHPEDTIIDIRGQKIGGGSFSVIAGPCAIESEEQFLTIARAVKKEGANFLRGGAFKPRTSPYAFQGMGKEGIEIMKMAREETGLPIITEIMAPEQVGLHHEDIDVIQIGARNMQNFDLLKEAGKTKTPVLLKRGMSATYEEWLMSAEYIMAGGNDNVIFCERGIRTFETFTRNTLDISAVPVMKRKSHLPVVIDPSHAGGIFWLVDPLSRAAVAIGADGLTIEVHHKPEKAMSDGQQSLVPETFGKLMKNISAIREALLMTN